MQGHQYAVLRMFFVFSEENILCSSYFETKLLFLEREQLFFFLFYFGFSLFFLKKNSEHLNACVDV